LDGPLQILILFVSTGNLRWLPPQGKFNIPEGHYGKNIFKLFLSEISITYDCKHGLNVSWMVFYEICVFFCVN